MFIVASIRSVYEVSRQLFSQEGLLAFDSARENVLVRNTKGKEKLRKPSKHNEYKRDGRGPRLLRVWLHPTSRRHLTRI